MIEDYKRRKFTSDYFNISYPYKEIDIDKIIALSMEISDKDGVSFGYTMFVGNERKNFQDFGLTEDEIKNALKDDPCEISQIIPWWIYVYE